MWKYKRVIAIAIAILFLVVLFVLKNLPEEENLIENQAGLTSISDETLEELVVKDSDKDGVADWEESLWGMDAKNNDSDLDGVLDSQEVTQLRKESPEETIAVENLSETDKFSREFFSTVAALNQAGAVDSLMVENLTSALAESIQNSSPRKIYSAPEIQVISDSAGSVSNYNYAVEAIYTKYPVNQGVTSVLQEFFADGENVNVEALAKLEPIAVQMKKIISELIKVKTPVSLAELHLELVNGFQRLTENIEDITKYESDIIITLGAISQYEQNMELVEATLEKFASIINQ